MSCSLAAFSFFRQFGKSLCWKGRTIAKILHPFIVNGSHIRRQGCFPASNQTFRSRHERERDLPNCSEAEIP
jgi:hypothetical protein